MTNDSRRDGRTRFEAPQPRSPQLWRQRQSADAKDLLVFTEAICNYVFVMTARFDEYVARQATE